MPNRCECGAFLPGKYDRTYTNEDEVGGYYSRVYGVIKCRRCGKERTYSIEDPEEGDDTNGS